MNYDLCRLSALSIVGTLVIVPIHANAGDLLSMGFNAKVGLDAGTLQFLQVFPQNIREQFVKGVEQSLDRADLSIDKFFAHTEATLEGIQSTAACLREDVVSVPKDVVDRFFGKGLDPATVLNDELEMAQNAFTWTTPPVRIRIKYADIDAKSGAVGCKFNTPLMKAETRIVSDNAAHSWRLWARLVPLCKTPEECYGVVSSGLKKNLTEALQQDKDKVQAEQRFSRMKAPPASGGWFNSYKWEPYETSLSSMLQLNDELLLAQSDREKKGKEAVDALNVSMAEINTKLATGEAAIRKRGDRNQTLACNIGYNIVTKLNGVESQLSQVTGYEVLSPVNLTKYHEDVKRAKETALGWSKIKNGEIQNDGTKCTYFDISVIFRGLLR